MGHQLVVGAVILDNLKSPRRVLGARRTGPKGFCGRWEFPGGKVEDGENPESALLRELKEELGVDLVIGSELCNPEGRTWPISNELEMRLWLTVVDGAPPTPGDDHDALAWLDSGTIESIDWLDADRAAISELRRLLV